MTLLMALMEREFASIKVEEEVKEVEEEDGEEEEEKEEKMEEEKMEEEDGSIAKPLDYFR